MVMYSAYPTQEYLWTDFMNRIAMALNKNRTVLWKSSGFEEEYDAPVEDHEPEAKQMESALTGKVVSALALHAGPQHAPLSKRKRGKPPNYLGRYLGRELVSYFLGIQSNGGRHSVATGEKSQKDSGPLVQFIDAVIQPLNDYLQENNRPKLSAGSMARLALEERRDESRLKSMRRKSSGSSSTVQKNRVL